jgi:glycosyltransferase involved in cell wall biosynthesis
METSMLRLAGQNQAGRRGGRIRALIIAEAANPEWVSVPLVGWKHARSVLDLVDGHIVTQVRNAQAIARSGLHHSRFTTIDSERLANPVHRLIKRIKGGDGKGWTTGMAFNLLSYLYFEELVWKRFAPEIRAGKYDIVHRVTPLSPTLPSTMAARCAGAGVPFVVGPLNGGVPWPRWFDRERRLEKEWLSYVRGVHRLAPGHRGMLRHASALVVGSSDVLRQIPHQYRRKCVYIPENGVDMANFPGPNVRERSGPLHIVFAGRLVPYKGADMLIEAAAPFVQAGSVMVSVIGDGPERPRLERMVAELKLQEGVRLFGWVNQSDVATRMADADLFVFPSIREFGGAVVLEAMAMGVPPVVVDYGGPGDLVTLDVGFKVPVGPREEIVTSVRGVIDRVLKDRSVLKEMGQRGRDRIQRLFTWEAKAAQTRRIYESVLAEQPLPAFGFLDELSSVDSAEREGAVA